MDKARRRNNLIDLLRGIAAINIIFIHTVFWSGGSYVPDFMRNIVLFLDVPFFFFLAGWSYSYSNKWENVIKKNVQLYIMTIAAILFSLIVAETFGDLIINKDLIAGIIKINPIRNPTARVFYSSLWFLRVFIPVSILFSVILPKIKAKNISSQFIFLLVIIYMISYFDNKFLVFNSSFWFHSIFYSIGYLSKDIKLNLKQLLIFIVPVISIVLFLVFGTYDFDMQSAKFPPAPLYLIISMISVMVSLYLKNFEFKIKFLESVGNNAMYSYLMQGFSSTLLVYIVGYFKFNWIIKLLLMFLINLALTIVLVYVYKKVYESIVKISKVYKKKIIGEYNE